MKKKRGAGNEKTHISALFSEQEDVVRRYSLDRSVWDLHRDSSGSPRPIPIKIAIFRAVVQAIYFRLDGGSFEIFSSSNLTIFSWPAAVASMSAVLSSISLASGSAP
jgi:hypothetical protein